MKDVTLVLFTNEKMYFVGWSSDVFLNTLLTNSPYTFLSKYGMHEIQPFGIMNMAGEQKFDVKERTVTWY